VGSNFIVKSCLGIFIVYNQMVMIYKGVADDDVPGKGPIMQVEIGITNLINHLDHYML
jgi:hypothetical protein